MSAEKSKKTNARLSLEAFVEEESTWRSDAQPIYVILLFTNPGDKLDELGFPDRGISDVPAFYYELDTAIQCMNENWADIQDHCFCAGFILARFPGTYPYCGKEARMYFLWDSERTGFFEAEEPESFAHLSI